MPFFKDGLAFLIKIETHQWYYHSTIIYTEYYYILYNSSLSIVIEKLRKVCFSYPVITVTYKWRFGWHILSENDGFQGQNDAEIGTILVRKV